MMRKRVTALMSSAPFCVQLIEEAALCVCVLKCCQVFCSLYACK